MLVVVSDARNIPCKSSGGRATVFAVLKIAPAIPDCRCPAVPWQPGRVPLRLQTTLKIPTAPAFTKHLRDNYAIIEVHEEGHVYPPTAHLVGLVKIRLRSVFNTYMQMCNN